MIETFLAGSCLVAITAIIHVAGLGWILIHVLHSTRAPDTRFWSIIWLLIRTVWWLILIHLFEIAVWALFFWAQRCQPDLETALYFSGVTYATLGYGDVLLPQEWRLLGPVEALTGTVMCGLSTAFFFAVVSRRLLHLIPSR